MKKNKILFVCVGNSVRSQIAESILRNKEIENIEVFSAGAFPAQYVDELTKEVLDENNIYFSELNPEDVMKYKEKEFDYVILLDETISRSLPTFPGDPEVLNWYMDDPIRVLGSRERKKEAFQSIFNKIDNKISEFLDNKYEE